jgi:hypothetical protein
MMVTIIATSDVTGRALTIVEREVLPRRRQWHVRHNGGDLVVSMYVSALCWARPSGSRRQLDEAEFTEDIVRRAVIAAARRAIDRGEANATVESEDLYRAAGEIK